MPVLISSYIEQFHIFMEQIEKNWTALRARINLACEQARRDPDEIEVVAVGKTRTADEIRAVAERGLTVVGENRVQEADGKIAVLSEGIIWHLIGHLQRNKAKRAVALFEMIQSVDSLRVARALDLQAGEVQKTQDVLLQVNTSGEQSKFGVSPTAANELAAGVANLNNLKVRGLMTIGAHSENKSKIRASFRGLREVREQLREMPGVDMSILSMGMSGDFELAISEGANMIRLGTALFGPRKA